MTVLEIALKLLNEYELDAKYVNLSLQSHLADKLDSPMRAQLTALLYTTVERKLTYDYYIAYLSGRGIGEIDIEVKNILRLGLCQILDMDSVPDYAAVNSTVELSRGSTRGFVNGVLRRAVREKGNLPLPSRDKKPLRYLSVAYSVPSELVRRFYSVFGEKTEDLLRAFNTHRGLTVSVNTKKISREDYAALLTKSGVSFTKSTLSEIALCLDKSYNPKKLPGYDDGLFFVQDEASSAAVGALGASSGLLVDVCAAPGGKSFAAVMLSGGELSVKSFDISEAKLPLIADGAQRLSLSNITAAVCDATEPREELLGMADYVICDAPCSGFGVLSKKPDIRYKSLDGISALPELQKKILSSASQYLKRGGVMIYSTCTLLPEENERVVLDFLSENDSFEAVDFKIGNYESSKGMFTFLPHIHNTDGFFVAKLRKK